jgi:hypothetical protein
MEQSNYSSVIQDSSVAFTFTAPNDHRETNFYLARSGASLTSIAATRTLQPIRFPKHRSVLV